MGTCYFFKCFKIVKTETRYEKLLNWTRMNEVKWKSNYRCNSWNFIFCIRSLRM